MSLCAGIVLVAGGCALDRSGLGMVEEQARDAGASADAQTLDAERPDAAENDAAGPDDAGPLPDVARPDAGEGACARVDDDVLALFPFDGDEGTLDISDVAGGHDGSFVRTHEWTDGPAGCGRAPEFTGSPQTYGVIPDSDDWDLGVGSFDLWIRFDGTIPLATGDVVIILSRDASGSAFSGHFTMLVAEGGRLVVRFQTLTTSHYYCSDDPITAGRWTHVGVNFGPPATEIFVDGVRPTRSDTVSARFGRVEVQPCNRGGAPHIDGNGNPWVIGVGANSSAEGAATPIRNEPFEPGAIDHLRISRVHRDFAVDR